MKKPKGNKKFKRLKRSTHWENVVVFRRPPRITQTCGFDLELFFIIIITFFK